MELTFAKCEAIANTLPIGLYTGRRIPVEVAEKETHSFYSTMEDRIVISYPIIAERMKQIKDGTCDDEEAIRSMLYHEVSHAILTPTELPADIPVNIFEDERIESVLRNYYHGVNFRKQLYDIHGGHAPKATNAETAFFNAVRFGLGSGDIQKEVGRLLKKYSKMNRNAKRWSDSKEQGYIDYRDDIHNLYRAIEKDFRKNPDDYNEPQSGEGNGEMKQMDSMQSGNGQQQASQNNPQNGKSQSKDGEGQEESQFSLNRDSELPDLSMKDIQRMVGQCLGNKSGVSEEEQEKLDEFQKTAEMIIGNFNKKNGGGSGINTYSGVFNPRNVARKDYRYFDRAMTTQGNNKFGTCHLNLIIDCSGSFHPNVALTNGILAVLSEIERKNRNFSMDVAFINHEFHICQTVRERKMVANGGNDIPDDMKEILMKLQKPQTCNYNIILFDGDAICNRWGSYDGNKLFGVFDMKQTTLITDPDNEQYMNPPFTSTKVIVTRDYTAELIKHITNALTIAFG